jgi:hypothetical protein
LGAGLLRWIDAARIADLVRYRRRPLHWILAPIGKRIVGSGDSCDPRTAQARPRFVESRLSGFRDPYWFCGVNHARYKLNIDGVLIAPFVAYAVGALVIFLILRRWLRWFGPDGLFVNPPLAEAAAYVCILGLLVLLW